MVALKYSNNFLNRKKRKRKLSVFLKPKVLIQIPSGNLVLKCAKMMNVGLL